MSMRQAIEICDLRLDVFGGVYRPQADSQMILDAFRALDLQPGSTVLDLCSGSGVLAIAAAARGHDVTAVDANRRAVENVRWNAQLNYMPVEVLHGDLFEPVQGRRFDVVLSNPPYVPTPAGGHLTRDIAWDAGADGRHVIDRICANAFPYLHDGGSLLLVHSSLAGLDHTNRDLSGSGLKTEILKQKDHPFGPISLERLEYLHSRGLPQTDSPVEQLAVFRATRPGRLFGSNQKRSVVKSRNDPSQALPHARVKL